MNEIYSANTAQETISGDQGSPITNYAAWPTSGITLKNLTINNTSTTGVTLRHDRRVNNVLTLTDGLLFTGACNAATSGTPLLTLAAGSSVSGGGAGSYVSGVMRKVGNTAFNFPVGGNGKYGPVHITAPGTITDQFTACFSKTNATAGTTKDPDVRDVSTCEHWAINRTEAVSTDVNISLNYDESDVCKPTDCKQIVRLGGAVWKDSGLDTAFGPTYITSEPTTGQGVFTWASGVLPVNHTNSATGDETKIGFGTQATMATDFPNNRTGGFIAFDTKSKGFVIPRVSNANRPAGAEGLLIYNTDTGCIQMFSSGTWKCIEPVCE